MYKKYDIKDKRGFSLPELIAVLIILVLIALLAINTIRGALNKAEDVIDSDTEKQIINAAEKWAIENSDKFDDVEGKKIQVGLDVVFIVDTSGGMNNRPAVRPFFNKASSTIDSINSALEILKQNDDNRVGFVFFSGKDSAETYTSSSSPLWNKDKSIIYETTSLENISNVKRLDKTIIKSGTYQGTVDEAKISFKNYDKTFVFGGGTYTQLAIQKAANLLFNSASKKGRIPVIILVTDGEPSVGKGDKELTFNDYLTIRDANTGHGATTWCLSTIVWRDGEKYATSPYYKDSVYGACKKITSYNKDSATNRSVIMSMNVMNAATFAKEQLSSAYNSNAFFYTIGIGLTSDYARFLLNPTVKTYDNLKTSRSQIKTNDFNDMNYWDTLWHVDISEKLYDYIEKNYNGKYLAYPTKAFVDENMTADDLKNAFIEISNEITEATKVTEVCVTIDELYKQGYLSKKDIKLKNGMKPSEYVIMSINEATNQYAFSLAKTADQKAECEKYLIGNSNK